MQRMVRELESIPLIPLHRPADGPGRSLPSAGGDGSVASSFSGLSAWHSSPRRPYRARRPESDGALATGRVALNAEIAEVVSSIALDHGHMYFTGFAKAGTPSPPSGTASLQPFRVALESRTGSREASSSRTTCPWRGLGFLDRLPAAVDHIVTLRGSGSSPAARLVWDRRRRGPPGSVRPLDPDQGRFRRGGRRRQPRPRCSTGFYLLRQTAP